ncbi:MAG: nucleoside-triphosphatase [Thermoplasmatota archaeon]
MNILHTGGRDSGKSTFLHELTASLDLACGGVISLPAMEQGEKIGMDALDVATGIRVPFARLDGDGIPVGRYRLRRKGIAHARRAIYRGAMTRQLTFVDELGPLELRDGGLMPAARFALRRAPHAVFVVRRRLADRVASRLQDDFIRVCSREQLTGLLTGLHRKL